MITWMSTKSPIRMLDTPRGQEVENHILANRGVDSALLAADLGLSQWHVESFQRRLGLRKLSLPGGRRR